MKRLIKRVVLINKPARAGLLIKNKSELKLLVKLFTTYHVESSCFRNFIGDCQIMLALSGFSTATF